MFMFNVLEDKNLCNFAKNLYIYMVDICTLCTFVASKTHDLDW